MKRILISILAVSPLFTFSQAVPKKITLEDIFKNRTFSSKGISGINPMKDGIHYSQIRKDSLNIYEYQTGNLSGTVVTSKQLIPEGDTIPVSLSGYAFCKNEDKILFSKDEEAIYRHSSRANYYCYDLKSKKLTLLSNYGKQRLATFSPDGSRIAFVRDNNIFVKELSGGKEIQVTSDGRVNQIINGASDWVYEEEFGFSLAYFWSPDSKKIAFYRFDESGVKEYELTTYGELYPEHSEYRYPKAGEDNSKISLFVWDVSSGKTLRVDIGKETDIYIPRVQWTNDPGVLAFYRMNRHQNKLELMLASAGSGKSRPIYTEQNKTYIEINDHLHFLRNNSGFLLSSEKDGYRHIYHYDIDGKLLNQITSGSWEVADICAIDEDQQKLYYSSTEVSPLGRNVYCIGFDGNNKVCVTPDKGYNIAEFSRNQKYFINRWSDINTPPVVSVRQADGMLVRVIQDNSKLKDVMRDYNFSKAVFFKVKTQDGTELNGWMLKPPDFDSLKRYPVLFTIYGGPGSQTVENLWGMVSSWNQLFAQNGIIVVAVDNRGTGGRGEAFKKCTYLELGKYETMDQIDAAKYLGSLEYVDKSRIGMWGWSFGGYMTLSCLTIGSDYFHMGVAVAPVTNWKYYDNIYTERFMTTPKENPRGYESNSPINHASELKGKLLIIHGMSDDNVHAQNTYDFVAALTEANKQFEMQLYPNSNHGIYTGRNTTFHLYNRMTEFILKNL